MIKSPLVVNVEVFTAFYKQQLPQQLLDNKVHSEDVGWLQVERRIFKVVLIVRKTSIIRGIWLAREEPTIENLLRLSR